MWSQSCLIRLWKRQQAICAVCICTAEVTFAYYKTLDVSVLSICSIKYEEIREERSGILSFGKTDANQLASSPAYFQHFLDENVSDILHPFPNTS